MFPVARYGTPVTVSRFVAVSPPPLPPWGCPERSVSDGSGHHSQACIRTSQGPGPARAFANGLKGTLRRPRPAALPTLAGFSPSAAQRGTHAHLPAVLENGDRDFSLGYSLAEMSKGRRYRDTPSETKMTPCGSEPGRAERAGARHPGGMDSRTIRRPARSSPCFREPRAGG